MFAGKKRPRVQQKKDCVKKVQLNEEMPEYSVTSNKAATLEVIFTESAKPH